ncbi:hypothetical protein PG995_005312 [Apiospora arundinis]
MLMLLGLGVDDGLRLVASRVLVGYGAGRVSGSRGVDPAAVRLHRAVGGDVEAVVASRNLASVPLVDGLLLVVLLVVLVVLVILVVVVLVLVLLVLLLILLLVLLVLLLVLVIVIVIVTGALGEVEVAVRAPAQAGEDGALVRAVGALVDDD